MNKISSYRPCDEVKNQADLKKSPNASEKEANLIGTSSAVTAQGVLAASFDNECLDQIQQDKSRYLLTGEGVFNTRVHWIQAGKALAKMDSDWNRDFYYKVKNLVCEGKLEEANELKKQMVYTMPMARPLGLSAESRFSELQFNRRSRGIEWNHKVLLDYDSHSEEKSTELFLSIVKKRNSKNASYSLMGIIRFIEIKFSIRGGLHLLVPSVKGLTLKGSIHFYEYLFRSVLEEAEYANLVTENGVLFDPAINTHMKLCLEAPTEALLIVDTKLYATWDVQPEENEGFKVLGKQFCAENWQNAAYFQAPEAVANYFRKEVNVEENSKKNKRTAIPEPIEVTEEQRESIKRTIDEVIVPQRIDITRGEPAWFQLGNALYNVLGETEGRSYYHKLSQFYPNYSYTECDRKFCRIAENSGYHYTYETFVYFCQMYDVQPINNIEYAGNN